jgi:hypothetical protein
MMASSRYFPGPYFNDTEELQRLLPDQDGLDNGRSMGKDYQILLKRGEIPEGGLFFYSHRREFTNYLHSGSVGSQCREETLEMLGGW